MSRQLTIPQIQGPKLAALSIQELELALETYLAAQKNHELQSDYLKANEFKERVREVKQALKSALLRDIQIRQSEEIRALEHQLKQELENFSSFWKNQSKEYEIQARNLITSIYERQKNDEESLLTQLNGILPLDARPSTEWLRLKDMEEWAVKQENYIEAHQRQLEKQDVRKRDQVRWLEQRKNRIQNLMDQFRVKCDQEMSTIVQRIKDGKVKEEDLRLKEEAKIAQRYQNLRREIQQKQAFELRVAERQNITDTTFMTVSAQTRQVTETTDPYHIYGRE